MDIICHNNIMFKKMAAVFILIFSFSNTAFPAEAGYQEALDYFVTRDKAKGAGSKEQAVDTSGVRASIVDRSDNIILNPQKYFLGVGAGEIFGSEHYAIELGMAFIQHRYFQQSLHFEYIYFNTKDFDEYLTGAIENSYGQGVFLLHNVQLSSQFFYLGPEISAGVGRIFDSPRKGALLMLKAGLVYSNKWTNRFLMSAHLYYRRSQYFKRDDHDDGVGFSLRFGF